MSSPGRPGSRTPRRQERAEEAPRTPRTPRQQRNVEAEAAPRTPRTPRQQRNAEAEAAPRTPRTPRQQRNAEAEAAPRTPRTPRQQRGVEEAPSSPRTPRQPARATPARVTPARAGPSTGTPRGTPGRFATPGKSVPGSGRPASRSSRSDSSSFTPQRFGAQRQVNGEGMVIDASDSSIPPSSSPAVRDRPSSPLGYVGGMSEIDLSSPLNYGTPSSMGSVRTPRSGVRGTPIRLRPDIRTDRRIRQINVQPPGSGEGREASSQPSSEPDQAHEPGLVIWGTDVSVSRCKERFKLFVQTFVEPNTEQDERLEDMDDSQPLYMQKLEEVHFLEDPFLNLNCAHLESFDPTLARQLICYPQEVIPILDMAINEMFFEKHPAAVLSHQIQIRPFNTHMTKNMRSLNPEDVDQLITLTGMVIRTSNTIPEMREAFFKCMACDFTTSVEIDRGRIAEPTLCTNCNTNHCFGLIHNRSQFTDKQMIKLQESPDDMPAGQTPHTIVLYAHNDLVDAVLPGDRVFVTGIYRAIPIKVNPRMTSVRAIYKTYIDVVHFRKMDSKRLYEQEGTSLRLTPERIDLLKSLSEKADVYDRLSRAIAPSIFGNEDIKKGILLQLFGGTKKTFSAEGRAHFRAEINILLCGDPGTSKSQLLSYVYNLVPRSQYTSGKGSSAVGLTAYVTKDPETRQLVLQTGALVLADNGICCIDEFDKMDDSTRSVLHEVMEQQTLSIAKAGIICQLNARTSVLAAANPCESQWNTNKTIIENIQLPHTLLSRFDLIFLLLDPQSDIFDRKLARHLVSLYYRSQEEDEDELLDRTILRDYLAYARENIQPQLTEEASQSLVQTYVDMRTVGSGKGQVSAYPRQLESLIRLSEAHAKMRFSQKVEIEDVTEAYRLHREALKQSAVDPATGKIDISIITTGYSTSARERRIETTQLLKKLFSEKPKNSTLNSQKLFKELKDRASFRIVPEMFEESLKDCQDDNIIVIVNKNTVRLS